MTSDNGDTTSLRAAYAISGDVYALESDMPTGAPDPLIVRSAPMSDLSAVVFFLGCLALTAALIRACDWLRPRDVKPTDAHASGTGSEVRR
ncbi:MAG: hypothetical protein IBJ18_13800 [Phycisphaerales bacterium]|nr:hypothetical protein [Phycisphaerales bacterium]